MPHRKRTPRFSPSDWETLGRAVKRARAMADMSQAALAKRARVSVDVIERLESDPHTGGDISPTSLYKIEHALGWPAGEAERILCGSTVAPQVPTPTDARRARVLDQLQGIQGLGRNEIAALISAFDRETGNIT